MFQIVHIYLEASAGHLNPIVLLFQIEKEIFNVIWRMSLSLQTEKKKNSRTAATDILTRALNEK